MTKALKLTKTAVDKLTIPASENGKRKQIIYRDTQLNGFGIRVTSNGSKSFIVEQKLNGRTKRITIAKYGHLTTEQARKEAQRILGELAVGKDPTAERKAAEVMKITLAEAFSDYLNTRKDLKPGTIKDYKRVMTEVLPTWQNKRLTDIDKDMVERKHSEYGKQSPSRANNAMRVLRAIFNHAIKKYEDAEGNPILRHNPVSRISNNRAWYKITRKQSVLKSHELPRWWSEVEQLSNKRTENYIKFVVLTGLRLTEAAQIQWKDLDLKLNTVTIVGNEVGIENSVAKNGDQLVLPLPDYLSEMFSDMHNETDTSSPYVFPSYKANSKKPYFTSPGSAFRRLNQRTGLKHTCHDLRRTFITVAESLDLSAYVLKRMMNHRMNNDITAGYIISDVERMRDPMQRVTDKFMELIYGDTATAA